MNRRVTVSLSLGAAFVAVGALSTGGLAWGEAGGVEGGASIYRTGVRLSGAPVRATVLGDVKVSGGEAACVGCHQRSGLGTFEGSAAAPPVAGKILFAPRSTVVRGRPAYTPESLARTLREGVDPGGRRLDPLMPRYDVSDGDAEELSGYLRGLSVGPSPGVDERVIHLASVVTPDADPEAKAAMVAVLDQFAEMTRKRMRGQGRKGKRIHDNAFREWSVEIWDLSGPPATWAGQLETRYAARPVFALLSGLGGTEWAPVHDFCERLGLPCILPNVEFPPVTAGQGIYNYYFGRGLALEASAMAKAILEAGGRRVVQDGGGKASSLASLAARELASALSGRPEVSLKELPVATAADLREATDVVLWLSPRELEGSAKRLKAIRPGTRIYLSSSLLGEKPELALPPALASHALIARPFSLPEELDRRFRRPETWLRAWKIPVSDRRVLDQTYTACQVFGEALSDVGINLIRDYLIEGIDHGGGLEQVSSFYPRLSFGPGLRVLSRGCYLAPAAGTGAPRWLQL